MKTKMKMKWLPSAFVAAGLLAGCQPSNSPETESTRPSATTNQSPSDVKKEVREAVEATQEAAARAKEQFIASAGAKLDQMDTEIGRLTRRAETLSGDAKDRFSSALTALNQKRSQVGERFEEIKKASGAAWKEVKTGFEAAMKDLEKAFEDAKSDQS